MIKYFSIVNRWMLYLCFTALALALSQEIEAYPVILGGQDFSSNTPLVYTFESGANVATVITNPNTDSGQFNSVAIGPDGTAILGGQDINTGLALMYRVSPGSNVATVITTPNMDNGKINSVAIGPDGTAILGGEDLTTNVSLMYRVSPGSNVATVITCSNTDGGKINSVAMGPDGTAILGSDTAVIYQVSPGSNTATVILNPTNTDTGQINSVAIYNPYLMPPIGIQGAQKKNDFGFQYEIYNTLQWQSSPTTLVTGYNVYRNGIKIASLGKDSVSYEDHHRKKGADTSYAVTAVTAYGYESTPIEVTIK